MKLKIFLIAFFTLSLTFSQTHQPIDTLDYLKREELTKNYKAEHEVFYKRLKKLYKGKTRKELTLVYKSVNEELLKNIRKKRFIFDPRFTSYTDSLLQVIVQANPELAKENLQFYVSKNPDINAMSMGGGIIILNTGLFKYLENEAQLVSVISHEVAHERLNHVRNSILKTVLQNTSKEKRQQARQIRRERYNTYDKAFKVMKGIMYASRKEKRMREMQADSIGYLLYKNTTFAKEDYINSLKLLVKYDSMPEITLDSTVYAKFFDLPAQPFQKEWMEMEEFSSYNYSQFKEKINKDSLRSHPELTKRIEKLEVEFPELKTSKTSTAEKNSRFDQLKELASQEDVVNLYYLEKYGLSVQLILYKLSKNPDDAYLKEWLGKNFLAMHKAKKKYQLNRHIETVNPKDQSKNYQQFLSFLWNLRLTELETIGNFYAPQKEDQ